MFDNSGCFCTSNKLISTDIDTTVSILNDIAAVQKVECTAVLSFRKPIGNCHFKY